MSTTTTQEAYFAALRSDLRVFLLQSFHTLYPGKQFLDNWHIDAILHCLEESIRGQVPPADHQPAAPAAQVLHGQRRLARLPPRYGSDGQDHLRQLLRRTGEDARARLQASRRERLVSAGLCRSPADQDD